MIYESTLGLIIKSFFIDFFKKFLDNGLNVGMNISLCNKMHFIITYCL